MDIAKAVVVLLVVGSILYGLTHVGYATWNEFHATRHYSLSDVDDLRARAFAWARLALMGLGVFVLGLIFAALSVDPSFVWAVIFTGVTTIVIGQTGFTALNRRADRQS